MNKIVQISAVPETEHQATTVFALDDTGQIHALRRNLEYSEDRTTATASYEWNQLPPLPKQ